MRDFGAYLAALWRHGSPLLTGGIIGVGVTTYGLLTGKNLPQGIGFLIFGLALMVAPYLAWKHERKQIPIPKPTPTLDPAILGELQRLNAYQIFALRQLAKTGVMTGEQFEQRYRELGFPVATLAQRKDIRKIFEELNQETTLLAQDENGIWRLRDRDGVRAALS